MINWKKFGKSKYFKGHMSFWSSSNSGLNSKHAMLLNTLLLFFLEHLVHVIHHFQTLVSHSRFKWLHFQTLVSHSRTCIHSGAVGKDHHHRGYSTGVQWVDIGYRGTSNPCMKQYASTNSIWIYTEMSSLKWHKNSSGRWNWKYSWSFAEVSLCDLVVVGLYMCFLIACFYSQACSSNSNINCIFHNKGSLCPSIHLLHLQDYRIFGGPPLHWCSGP